MTCEEAQSLITPAVDCRLSTVQTESLKQHLIQCRSCNDLYHTEHQVKKIVQLNCKHKPIPTHLTHSVSEFLNHPDTVSSNQKKSLAGFFNQGNHVVVIIGIAIGILTIGILLVHYLP